MSGNFGWRLCSCGGVSLDGSATIEDNTAPLDLDFKDDVWENLEAVYTVHFEARKDRFTLLAEYQFLNLTPNVGIGPVEADIDFKSTLFEAAGAYAFSVNDRTRWEALLGLRYNDHEIDVEALLNFPPPVGSVNINGGGGDDWIHAMLGARVEHAITDKWSFLARADYGYGDSDNTAINGSFMFDYKFNGWGSVFVGFKYMSFDYDNDKETGRYAYDADQQGPLLGLNIRW